MAVYEEQEAQQRGLANSSLTPSPDLYQSELSVFQPIAGGEIEVNSSALKSSKYFFFLMYLSTFHCFLVVSCSGVKMLHFPPHVEKSYFPKVNIIKFILKKKRRFCKQVQIQRKIQFIKIRSALSASFIMHMQGI